MDYVCPVNEVEQQLKEAGEQLSMPPSSTKDLLDLLDKIEQLLTFVGQAPSISMQGALVPSMGALIADEITGHSDVDVRVSVASCLCEVARITAPEPPYKDEVMKDIFQLNVMAFGELSNVTGRSYYKAIHILESVAKVKSCLLMLDLECDALILEMFEQFLSTIRINHPHTVFSDMETIMTLVIEESDEIATELLSLLISHVRKENQNVSPAPWKLAEKVLRNCNDTLKSYSQTIMNLIKSDPDDYAEVVTSLCQNAYGNEVVATRSAMTESIHKKANNTLENGGSTKTLMHSQPKKKKYIDTQRGPAVPKKIDRKPDTEGHHKNQLKGKEPEASQNLSSAHESHSAKGRLKNKKNNLNQDTRPVQNSKEDMRRTKFQDKASHSAGLSLKQKSEGMKGSTRKPEKGSTKTKGNIKTSGSLHNVVIKKEDEVLSDSGGAEPLFRQMNDKVRSRRKPPFKKHVAEGSHDKDLKDACNLKQYGRALVGRRVKVWWPLDQMYYEGAVSSYDPIHKKYKVLYADGDEEILDLRYERWKMLDEMSPDQEQVADPPSSVTTSVKKRKQKAKRKTESSLNSSSPKSQTPACLSKTEPTKEHDIKGANSPTTDIPCNVDNQKDDPVQIPDISCGLKSTEKPDMEQPKMINNVEQDGGPNLSGELEEAKMPEESETKTGKRRRLVKNEELVCQT